MPQPRRDTRPPMAVAMTWVSRLTSISLEMALPALLGHWLDGRWGTAPWLTVVGAALGFTVSMYHLLKIVQQADDRRDDRGR